MKKMLVLLFLGFVTMVHGEAKKETINFIPNKIILQTSAEVSIQGEDRQDVEITYDFKGQQPDITRSITELKIVAGLEDKKKCFIFCYESNPNYSIKIKTPLNVVLYIENSNNDTEINNINGHIKVLSTNGEIEANNIIGNLYFDTNNDDIKVINIEGLVRLRTSNGSIKVENADTIEELSTSNGNITTDVKDIVEEAKVKTSNGKINLNLKNNNFHMSASTSNGKIIFFKNGNYAEVKNPFTGSFGLTPENNLNVETSNGNITVRNVEGIQL